MSKADITSVATLAAHLARAYRLADELTGAMSGAMIQQSPSQCASDAMQLQRLGRSAMNAMDRKMDSDAGRLTYNYSERERNEAWEYVTQKALTILAPYGLKAECRDEPFRAECLYILGLPGNTPGAEGFGI